MKSLGKFPDPFIVEIAGQPDALRRAAAGLAEQRDVLAAAGETAAGRSVVFTGMGSSYDACYPAITGLAERGVPAVMVDTAELVHFRNGLLGPDTLVVAVSQSGESAEIVRLAGVLQGRSDRATLVSVTNGSANPLATVADLALDTRSGREVGPSTMTFAGSLAVVAAVGRVLGGDEPATTIQRVTGWADAAATALDGLLDRDDVPDRLLAWHADRPTTVLLGRGSARAAAEMGALTIKEATGLAVESLETAQFRHGPLELAGPRLAVMIIATERQTLDLDLGFASHLVSVGAAVSVITAGAGAVPEGAIAVDIGPISGPLVPAVSILPAQLLAWRLSVRMGREPGAYYRASKVTKVE
jgi:glucosamine--fructose-6-phosphate aminotransferase (isomerizing)